MSAFTSTTTTITEMQTFTNSEIWRTQDFCKVIYQEVHPEHCRQGWSPKNNPAGQPGSCSSLAARAGTHPWCQQLRGNARGQEEKDRRMETTRWHHASRAGICLAPRFSGGILINWKCILENKTGSFLKSIVFSILCIYKSHLVLPQRCGYRYIF